MSRFKIKFQQINAKICRMDKSQLEAVVMIFYFVAVMYWI